MEFECIIEALFNHWIKFAGAGSPSGHLKSFVAGAEVGEDVARRGLSKII